jgi:SpoVK/Ycf46/Vps4 family AAA+-type ATPase
MTLATDVDLEEYIMSKDDLSGADIKAICTEAGLLALRERRMKVTHIFLFPLPLRFLVILFLSSFSSSSFYYFMSYPSHPSASCQLFPSPGDAGGLQEV